MLSANLAVAYERTLKVHIYGSSSTR